MRHPTFTLLILQNCALPLIEMENSGECIPPSESFNEDPNRVSLTTNNNKSKECGKRNLVTIFKACMGLERFHQLVRNNTVYKEQANKDLVEFTITDSQPFICLITQDL
ncbi:22532_t:CDS:2 [Gigaspora margarita]|uniref:22532_t:CDS:1 n=1 Tax=Gigaspora margarita TaxID=4874 RepID=A0ABN7V7G6_GIGMA|nr:22532_t:CDS:2 [Gigaspora margarita]